MSGNVHDSDDDDVALLSSLIQGDESAFDRIYNRYSETLYYYAYKHSGSKEDSREMVQNIFLSLWEKRGCLNTILVLRHYLFGSIRYQVVIYYRKKEVRDRFAAEYAFSNSPVDNSNQQMQDLRDTENQIERAISSMPERIQVAFRLSRQEHLSIEHIATRMNISPRAVENYISEALKRLRASLGNLITLLVWLNC